MDTEGLNAGEVARISGLLAESFLEAHRGFRLNRLLRELSSNDELEIGRVCFESLQHFPNWIVQRYCLPETTHIALVTLSLL